MAVLIPFWLHLGNRLPEWNTESALWVSAANACPDEPASLNNAAFYNPGDARVEQWLAVGGVLDYPPWLPKADRVAYISARMGLARLRHLQGRDLESYSDFIGAVNMYPQSFQFHVAK